MRVLLTLMMMLLVVGLLGFIITNPAETVSVTLWSKQYTDVRLSIVVLISLTIGAAFTGLIALAEGASIRLNNHRLRRRLQRLENEINLVRTEPAASPRSEPDALDASPAARAASAASPRPGGATPPSAPVFGPPEGDGDDPEDDDVYSGGRAV